MGGAADLYSIGLEPSTPDGGVPNAARPRGAIGGSDVGANEEEDQRVRDLIQQFLEEATTMSWLINNFPASGGSDPVIAEFFNSDDVVLLFGSPSGGISATVTGQNRTVTFPGGPVRYQVGATFGIDYLPFAAGFAAFTGAVDIYMRLYIDGSLTYSNTVEQGMRLQAVTDEIIARVSLAKTVLLEEKELHHIEGTVSEANMITRLAAGDHTARVDIHISYPDDQFIQVEMWNEYFAFLNADADKITSLQDFDATTII